MRGIPRFSTHHKYNWDLGKGIDQLNLHSVQPGYLKILQMGNTDPRHKSRKTNTSPSQLGGRHSNPVVTTPMIALDFSGTTHQSASHNVTPNQFHVRHNNKSHNINHSMFKPKVAKAAQFVPQFHKFYLTDSQKGTAELTASNLLSPGFVNARQKLRASTPALIQGSKLVAIERDKLGEFNATKIVKNRGWKRRESAVESYGE
ncbi:putative RNA-dependent RNA polymerase 3-like [Dorcoceras hygrometricum]|uniref:Putative RNA-dependent RNA polymerase 3-like n=1 Tax=Dorcoceras hygrometricum TaxID=472368 RepID=A0A2Z7DC26_9LAMI|nr:putative RNA-dependent RNA polymerase 3-like [Dorcoceras hygrometricum]